MFVHYKKTRETKKKTIENYQHHDQCRLGISRRPRKVSVFPVLGVIVILILGGADGFKKNPKKKKPPKHGRKPEDVFDDA